MHLCLAIAIFGHIGIFYDIFNLEDAEVDIYTFLFIMLFFVSFAVERER
jgi:hypothetical protein